MSAPSPHIPSPHIPVLLDEVVAALRPVPGELIVDGVDTTIPLFHALLQEPDIHSGNYNIHWLEHWLEQALKAD